MMKDTVLDILVDLTGSEEVKQDLDRIENDIHDAKEKHNQFLRELGLPELK